MSASQYDVVVVGAGCAGLTAAIGLARSGFAVAVVETAATVGDAGALGGVCFSDNLAQPDLLGPDGVEAMAWERRLIERGTFATDGRRIAGHIYRDPQAFHHCYTVLRPVFDQHLAEIAVRHGVVLLTETTVESLIRDGRRIIGAVTTRGPLYCDLLFLAEGDAGHLVSREGLDRSSDRRDRPTFLYCLQQVIDLPPGVIEECFRVGAEEGVAYDFLLRNPGPSRLNARGQLCTNRRGLTLSVFLSVENLSRGFPGEPRQLLDWFVEMPALRRWLRDGQRGTWTATLLRTGGWSDVPYLVEDGLVVGGAATGLGVDFPVLNLTGPATVTGMLLSRAAARIRHEGRGFDRAALSRHYLEPLQQTRYWRDREFLNRWPGHLRRTHVLFDRGLDLFLDTTSIWGRSRRWLPWKLMSWLLMLARMPWLGWDELSGELIRLSRALHFREVRPRPALTRVLLDGALNAFRDLVRRPRPHLPPHGTLRLYFHSTEAEGRASAVPSLLRRWFERFRPVLASAGHKLYENDDMPLSAKLTRTIELLVRQVNLFDLVAGAGLALGIALTSTMLAAGRALFRRRPRRRGERSAGSVTSEEKKQDLALPAPPITPQAKGVSTPLIHVLWRSTQPSQQAASVRDLPHICPAGVFELEGASPETVQLAVHAERCISCEACWRTNTLVDWGRSSPMDNSSFAHPYFDPRHCGDEDSVLSLSTTVRDELASLLDQLEDKLHGFDRSLAEGPAVVDRPHNDYLEMLARYAHQLSIRVGEVLKENPGSPPRVLDLADALTVRAEERTRRTWDGRFAWATADGRLLRQHHLTGLRRLLRLQAKPRKAAAKDPAVRIDWLPSALTAPVWTAWGKHLLTGIAARRYLLETLEPNQHLTTKPHQTELLDALRTEVREDLIARTAEWNALGMGELSVVSPESSPAVAEEYRQYNSSLLVDVEQIRIFLDVPGDWTTLTQRRVLRAEREEIQVAERRLLALAADWREGRREIASEDDISAGFGRQAAHVLAAKQLLLRTFAQLEEGADIELALVLLRVWLDYAATVLDDFTIIVRDRLRSAARHRDRPLVEPGSGPPLQTEAEYRAVPESYKTGDFLLAPIDLLQPRLVPEMIEAAQGVPVGRAAALRASAAGDLLAALEEIKNRPRSCSCPRETLYLAEALVVDTIGRSTHPPSRALDLEMACTRLVLSDLRQDGGALPQRCLILQELVDTVVPCWLRGDADARVQHLNRDVLEVEARKADFRQRLTAVWQTFDAALGRNANVQASCFALAEAAAWLKAADSTLGRMAWRSRMSQVEEREEPTAQQELGRRVLRHCDAVIRDRLFRFDEDLASLRRG